MLALALASLLAAPPAGGSWSVTLHPAVVVAEEDPAPSVDLLEGADAPAGRLQEAPRLAPAKTLAPKAKARKVRPAAQTKGQGR